MKIESGALGKEDTICDLFFSSFSASEGTDEGHVIACFVKDMMAKTYVKDLRIFHASNEDELLGCLLFSRMVFDNDFRTVFILSPMAVHPDHQKRGIGQTLIREGIDALRDEGVDILLTYGDPAFYSKTGFKTITNKVAKPPFSLSQPQGWLMCNLAGENAKPLKGNSTCVPALMNSDLW